MFMRIAFLTVLFSALAFGQSQVDDFTRAANNDGSVGSSVFRNMTGQTGSGSWKVNSDGTASPYNSGGVGLAGAMYAYTPVTGSNGVQVSFVIAQRSSNNNTGDICILLMNDSNLTTADGYYARVMEITGSDRLDVRSFSNNNFPTGGGSGSGASVSLEFAVGDTIKLVLYPDGRKTAKRIKAGGATDSCTTTLAAFNLSGTIYAGVHGTVFADPDFRIDHFRVDPLAAGGGGGDATAPVAGVPVATPVPVNVGASFSVYSDITDNVALATTRIDSSPNGTTGWVTVGSTVTHSAALQVRAYRHTTSTISYASADSVWFRAVATDTAGNTHTSASLKVVIGSVAPPDTSAYIKRSIAYLYCASTEITVPGAPGQMPTDSVMWGLYTHATIFSPAVNATGDGFSNNAKYAPYIAAFPALAHANNVKIGITVGGWTGSDAVINAMANNPAGFASFLATTIRNNQIDFIDFDLEGGIWGQATYNSTVSPWFSRFYDTLQNISLTWTGAVTRPTIVLTINPGYTSSWGTVLSPMATKLDFVMLMSYDKMSAWSGAVIPDQVTITRNASNAIVLRAGPNGTSGQEHPSLEASAVMLTGTGFPANKVVVGFDFMGARATGGTYPTDTIMYAFRPYTTAPTMENAIEWFNFYPNYNANILPRIQFHPVGKFYWSYVDGGAGTTGDAFYSFGAYPGGYDSSIYYAFDMVNRRGLGGVMWWDIGESWTRTGTDKNWAQRSIGKYIDMFRDSTKQKLAPPTLTTPANNATGVSTSPLLDFANVTGSTEFWIQIATDAGFGTVVVSDSNFTISQYSASGLTAGTDYWWRVATQNTNGFGSFSSPFKFTTVPTTPGQVTLVSPSNAATNLSAILALSWSAVATADSYYVQVDSVSASFAALHPTATGYSAGTSRQVTLSPSKTYYWRVRAVNSAGNGTYSTTRSFTTSASKPPQVVLGTPALNAGSQDTNGLAFTWGASTGATSYRLQVSLSSSFGTKAVDTLTGNTSVTVSGLRGDTTYFWRVNAYNTDSSGYTTPWTFTTTKSSTIILPNANGQFLRYYSIALGRYVWNQPIDFYAVKRGVTDGTDIPVPPGPQYDYWTPYGIKKYTGTPGGQWVPHGSNTTSTKMTAAEMRDSLATLTGVKLNAPVVVGSVKLKATDSAAVTTIAPGSTNRSVSVTTPVYDGMLPVKNNPQESISIGAGQFAQPVDFTTSGGLGTNQANAVSQGQQGYVNIGSNGALNISPNIPYSVLTGVPASTNGGSTFDPTRTARFFDDFMFGGNGGTTTSDNIVGDGTFYIRQVGERNWRGVGFGTGGANAVRLSKKSPTTMNDFGILTMEADTAVTLGTARGGYITTAGSASVYDVPLMDTGSFYQTRIYTPTSIDSLGWFTGIVRRNMGSPASTQAFTTEEGIGFEFGKAPYTTNDTLYALVMGAADAVNRYALQRLTTGTFYTLKWVVSVGSIAFYVDGVLKATATTGLPATTDVGSYATGIWSYDKTAVGSGRLLGVDYIWHESSIVR